MGGTAEREESERRKERGRVGFLHAFPYKLFFFCLYGVFVNFLFPLAKLSSEAGRQRRGKRRVGEKSEGKTEVELVSFTPFPTNLLSLASRVLVFAGRRVREMPPIT